MRSSKKSSSLKPNNFIKSYQEVKGIGGLSPVEKEKVKKSKFLSILGNGKRP